MRQLSAFLFAAIAISFLNADAQQLRAPVTASPSSLRIVVLDFESPEEPMLGAAVAARVASSLCAQVPGLQGILVHHPQNDEERVSFNPQAVLDAARAHHALIAVWGEFYASGDTLTVYPRLRIVPVPGIRELDFGLVYETSHGSISAPIPSSQINFAPVVMRKSDLASFASSLGAGLQLRATPAADAPPAATVSAAQDIDMLEAKDGWVKVRAGEQPAGWMQTGSTAQDFSSTGIVVNGLVKFISGDYTAAERDFSEYVHRTREDQLGIATGYALLGVTRVRAVGNLRTMPKDEKATEAFDKGAVYEPEDFPGEFSVIVRLMKAGGGAADGVDLAGTERTLIHSVQDDPDSTTIKNLEVYYKLAEEKRFLQSSGTSDEAYKKDISSRLTTIDQVRRYILIPRNPFRSQNYGSVRVGLWSPADHELPFTYKDQTYDSKRGIITESIMYGLEFQSHNFLFPTVSLDVGASGWFSSYSMKVRNPGVKDTIESADVITVVVPLTLGVGFSPLSESPFKPWLSAGAGVNVGLTNRSVTFPGPSTAAKNTANDAQFVFTPAFYASGGVDVFVTPGIALSIGLRWQYTLFHDVLYNGAQDFSGVQISAGFSFVP